MTVLWVLLALVVVGVGFIRLAPSDPSQWHVVPAVTQDRDLPGGAMRILTDAEGALALIDAIARATPRTTVLAGSVDEGMITYITRSRIMGFPDYTTVRQEGDTLTVYARLRFGRSDLGVNRARIDGWLADLARIRSQG
ncbi:MAG: DUF1499 domain-containing protein [Proteobacteria bacterium]|nr:DUF1499 domain-containing protein [Pseudomonadota bacterium]